MRMFVDTQGGSSRAQGVRLLRGGGLTITHMAETTNDIVAQIHTDAERRLR
jgi:hypothetical protein